MKKKKNKKTCIKSKMTQNIQKRPYNKERCDSKCT